MSDYNLISNVYTAVTPAGAFHAVTGSSEEPARNLLVELLRQPETVRLDQQNVTHICPTEISEAPLELLYRMQHVGWIEGVQASRAAPDLNMERDVPELLSRLSSEGKALLADAQGFNLSECGFVHETAEELSALAADVYTVYQRHQPLVRNNLRFNATGWGAVNASGDSLVGFWPMHVSQQAFVLVLAGVPSLNGREFVDLVWWLTRRYTEQA